MSDKTIVYGDVVSTDDRRQLSARYPQVDQRITWKDEAILFQAGEGYSLIFVDLDSPRFSSGEFIFSLATAGKQTRLIGKLNEPDDETSIKVARYGVSEILTPDQCLLQLQSFLEELETAVDQSSGSSSKYTVDALIGHSPHILEIRSTVMLLSDVDFPSALILGETGTGKSLVSKVLHHTGMRSEHNLVEVNCSAIPDDLFESELFGHVKGAFTDAKSEKLGLFEYAQEGTLFLDEVGNLSASSQAKLLKILEDRKLRKVGAVDERDINVRVVAATNIDLHHAIEAGTFREDLYFRLNLLTLQVPPLRQRPEDIPDTVKHYLVFYSTLYGKPGLGIAKTAVEAMQEHSWPGNVRELCNVIERAVLLTKSDEISFKEVSGALKSGRITAADRLQLTIDMPPQGISLEEIEQKAVLQVLNMCGWNKSEAAKILKISRPRLRRMIDAAGLEQNRRDA